MLIVVLLLGPAIAGGAYQFTRYQRARGDRAAAHAALASFNYEKAANHAARAADFWPSRGDVRLEAAVALRRAGRAAEAKPHLEAARERLGDIEEIRLEQQLLVAQQGEASEEAERLLRERADRDPARRGTILEALARGALSTFRLARAKDILDAWLAESSADPRPYYWRGDVQAELGGGLADTATVDLLRALELHPAHDEARERLAALFVLRKDPASALPHWEELHRRRPDAPRVLIGLARCRIDLGDTEGARPLLNRALELAPDDVEALREAGLLALNDGRLADAEPLLRRAYDLMPNDPFVSFNYQTCLFRLGRDEEAKKQQARHEELSAKLGRLADLVRREIQRRPNDPDLMHEIGTLYLKYGTPDQIPLGVWWLQRALEVAPSHAPSLRALADHFDKRQPALAARFRARLRK